MASQIPDRYCLVTVGATVGFKELTAAALHPELWSFLSSNGFTHLRVQCGPDIPWAAELLDEQEALIPDGLQIEVFDVRKNLMMEEMLFCKPRESEGRVVGLVISHAGTSHSCISDHFFLCSFVEIACFFINLFNSIFTLHHKPFIITNTSRHRHHP